MLWLKVVATIMSAIIVISALEDDTKLMNGIDLFTWFYYLGGSLLIYWAIWQ
jgi:hypothetical protein